MKPPDAVIVHISDLHFSGYLQNVYGQGEWSTVAKTHDFNVLLAAEARIRTILQTNMDRAIVVVTGDVTTAAEPPAFETVATYLLGEVWVSGRTAVGLRLVKTGLEHRLFVVPGNHDSWLRGGFFTRWKQYRDRRDLYRRYFDKWGVPAVVPVVVGGVSVLFLMMDSNDVVGFNPLNFRNVVGRGRVGKDQLAQLRAAVVGLKETPEGFDLSRALRIGVMHHHVGLPEETPQDLEQELLALEDAGDVVAALDELGVHLVLCGHQHFPFLVQPEGRRMWVSCAGTLTQRENEFNSFKAYWIRASANGRPSVVHNEYRRSNWVEGASKFDQQPGKRI